MKNIFLLFVFFFQALNMFSQGNDYHLRIKNAATGEAVEYAAVYFGSERGSYTNENGEIKIPFDVKEIEISHLLYETKKLSLAHGLSDIFLNPKQNILHEVVVRPSSGKKEKIGYHKEKVASSLGGGNGLLVAQYIPNSYQENEPNPLISSVILRLSEWRIIPEKEKAEGAKLFNAKLRVDLRLPDKDTGAPSDNSLIDGGVIFDGKYRNRKETIVDLPTYVPMPQEGVFIVVEWIAPEEQKIDDFVTPSLCTIALERYNMWVKKVFIGENHWEQEELLSQLMSEHIPKTKGKKPNLGVGLVVVK